MSFAIKMLLENEAALTNTDNNKLGSSRGLGLRIFIPATRIRIPYRVPNVENVTAIA